MKKKREALCLCKVIIASNTVQQDGVCREVLCHKDAKKRLFRHGIGEGEACPLPKEFRPVAGSGNALSDAGDPDDLKDPIGAGRDYRLVFKVCLEGKVPCPVRLDKDRVCKMGRQGRSVSMRLIPAGSCPVYSGIPAKGRMWVVVHRIFVPESSSERTFKSDVFPPLPVTEITPGPGQSAFARVSMRDASK